MPSEIGLPSWKLVAGGWHVAYATAPLALNRVSKKIRRPSAAARGSVS